MRSLRQLFDEHQGRLVGKVDHFFDDYEPWLAPVRGGNVRVLEIGVYRGGSLELWQEYFGASASVHGIDIDQRAAEHCPDGARIHIARRPTKSFCETWWNNTDPLTLSSMMAATRCPPDHVI